MGNNIKKKKVKDTTVDKNVNVTHIYIEQKTPSIFDKIKPRAKTEVILNKE